MYFLLPLCRMISPLLSLPPLALSQFHEFACLVNHSSLELSPSVLAFNFLPSFAIHPVTRSPFHPSDQLGQKLRDSRLDTDRPLPTIPLFIRIHSRFLLLRVAYSTSPARLTPADAPSDRISKTIHKKDPFFDSQSMRFSTSCQRFSDLMK